MCTAVTQFSLETFLLFSGAISISSLNNLVYIVTPPPSFSTFENHISDSALQFLFIAGNENANRIDLYVSICLNIMKTNVGLTGVRIKIQGFIRDLQVDHVTRDDSATMKRRGNDNTCKYHVPGSTDTFPFSFLLSSNS